jgi:hypothetical protein
MGPRHDSVMTSASLLTPRMSAISHRPAFWIVAAAFLAVMAFSTVPTPIYAIYQRRDGFPTWMITVIFAAYAIGVVASLVLVGHLSDWFGRRRMALISVLLQLCAALVFVLWPDVSGLLVARFVSGVGVGALTAAATAHLAELRAIGRPDSIGTAGLVATVINTGGLAVGPLVAGVVVTLLPAPLVTPYLVFALVLLIVGVLLALVPETVPMQSTRRAYQPQRPRIPEGDRGAFVGAGVAAFTGFAIFGFSTALIPTVLAATMAIHSPLIAGLTTSLVFASAAASQVALARLSAVAQRAIAVPAIVLGLACFAVGAFFGALAPFLVGGLLLGGGIGLLFRGAIATAGRLAPAERRSEVLASVFLIAYVGLTVPVLLVGIALSMLPAVPVVLTFAGVMAALVVVAAVRMRATVRPQG